MPQIDNIPPDVYSAGPVCVEHFKRCLDNGCSYNLAEMLALQKAPRGLTDDVYHAGIGTLAKQFEGDEKTLEALVKAAKKQGYTPNANDHYNSQIACCFGDAKAFIPHGARGHIKKVAEERGLDVSGAVNVKAYRAPEQDPMQNKKKMADSVRGSVSDKNPNP